MASEQVNPWDKKCPQCGEPAQTFEMFCCSGYCGLRFVTPRFRPTEATPEISDGSPSLKLRHVCGLQGFCRGIGSENDYCPACQPDLATEADWEWARIKGGGGKAKYAPEITEVEEARRIPKGQDWLAQSWTNGKRTVHTTIPPKHAANGSVEYDTAGAKEMAERMLVTPVAEIASARVELARIEHERVCTGSISHARMAQVLRAALTDKGGGR